MEDDVDELTESYFVKATARVYDNIDNRKASVLPSLKFFDLVETLGEGCNSEEI